MLTVLKIGGSVLRDNGSYARVAAFLAQRLEEHDRERLVVIVSAQYGVTDALFDEATEIIAADARVSAADRESLPVVAAKQQGGATNQHGSTAAATATWSAVGARAGRPTARASGSSSTCLSSRRARGGAARAGAPPPVPAEITGEDQRVSPTDQHGSTAAAIATSAVGARAGRLTARASGSSSTCLSSRRARGGAARAGTPPLVPADTTVADQRVLVADQHGSTRLPQDMLDLLWSTGEIRSVALLALHLERLGVHPAALNVHQSALGIGEDAAAGVVDVRPLHLLSALGRARVAIVPGFFAVRPGGAIASLGRGGSDLTAVLVAAALHADACELVKDVPGYFTADPHVHADATPVHELGIDAALAMAAAGCNLVQRAALHAAQRTRVPILVRSLDSTAHVTRLLPRSAADGILDQDDSRRTAVGA